MKMREIIGTIGVFKFIILMVASTFWVMVQHLPYVPLGLLIIVYFVGNCIILDEKIKLTQVGALKENRKFKIVK